MKNSGIDLYHSIIIIVISVMSIVVYTGKKKKGKGTRLH